MGGEISNAIAASPAVQAYFDMLQQQIDVCYSVAEKARKKGFDPELQVEIPQALDLAARVEELVGPKNIAPQIRRATKEIGNRERVSLEIAREIVKGNTFKFKTIEDALDQAIRTGLAILTEGVLVAPLEGIAEVKLGTNNDGTNYVDLYFSGPIRSAGGTGQAMSVLIADVVRRELGIDRYKPTSKEIERYKEEIPLYKRVQHLQYTPTADEIHRIVGNCPICINGEGTEDEEVTGNRDLPRVTTNRLRGGACLVIAEGLCLKAPKLLKHVKSLGLKGWEFLDLFVNRSNGEKENDQNQGIPGIPPSTKYIGEVIAGRPVLAYPSAKGGFRLRYGRARTGGLASTAISPASMHLFDGFIAVGTQMKMERPGKATIGTPCDELDGPIVLLHNGDLVQLNKDVSIDPSLIKQIVDNGEILIPYGEFLENNALLPNASYSYEWWIQDLQKILGFLPSEYTFSAVAEADERTQQKVNEDFGRNVDLTHPSFVDAVAIATKYNVPLHPAYNLFWHDISPMDVRDLAEYVKHHGAFDEQGHLYLPFEDRIKNILVTLGALHKKREGFVILDKFGYPLVRCLGLDVQGTSIIDTERFRILGQIDETESTVSLVSRLAGFEIRERAPFRIGTRMGRPEKAAKRKMRPPPHVLFPLGNYGSNQRLFSKAAEHETIEVEAGRRRCPTCGKTTYHIVCECGVHTEPVEGRIETYTINVNEELTRAKNNLRLRNLPEIIKGVQGTISKHKTPEPVEKGILRARHDVTVFKDGTIRFDMTDAPLTHFKPREIHVPLSKLKKLGYTSDYLGNPLERDDQICELKVQDVIISKVCAEYFIKVAAFVDDLLVRFYKQERFYKVRRLEDLTGHLVIGLAPHTSGGALGRIIGFTDAQVCFAHPYYHAAKRRNCFDFEQRVFLYDAGNDTFITEKIGDVVEEKLKTNPVNVIDVYDTKKIDVDPSEELYAYCVDKKTGKIQKKRVTCFIKGKTKTWIKIKTSTNRELKITPDHDVVTIKDNQFFIKKAKEIQRGERIPLAVTHPVETIVSEINLAEAFAQLKDDKVLENIHLTNAEIFFKKLVKKIGVHTVCKICDIKNSCNREDLNDWCKRVSLLDFKKICEHTNFCYDDLPEQTTIQYQRDSDAVPVYVKDLNSLFWVLGIYCARGWAKSDESSYQIGFTTDGINIGTTIETRIQTLFMLTPDKNNDQLIFSSKLLYLLLVKIWKTGSTARDKKVPEIVYHGNSEAVRNFISAYCEDVDSINFKPEKIIFYSLSSSLLEGIANLLLRQNIFARYDTSVTKKSTKNVLMPVQTQGELQAVYPVFQLVFTGEDQERFTKFVTPFPSENPPQLKTMQQVSSAASSRVINFNGMDYTAVSFSDYTFDFIEEITTETVDDDPTYCFDVEGVNLEDKIVLWHNQLLQLRCDGDEDGLMLLMDALLNFSHAYIPDKRGGRMDLPLILTTRLDPSEVDKETHNVDTLARYPLAFYEATLRHEHPKEVERIMGTVSERLGTPLQYEQFGFTHDTEDISAGPKTSRYKTLKSMMDKMNAQLDLAAKIRAVDEADVAYKVIERHFLPDILGNLKAFSRQSVRCPTCNITYRRIPLSGKCKECNGKLSLTVHEKSVKKYLEISKEIAERYRIPAYAYQRINLVEKSIDSLFMSDKIRKTKITDFL